MFQFKSKTSNDEVNPTNVDPSRALPNSYGKIRTLEEDYKDFKAGNLKKAQEATAKIESAPAAAAATPQPAAPQSQPKADLPNAPATANEKPSPPFPKDELKNEALNPFGSQSFFNEKSPFEGTDAVSSIKKEGDAKKTKANPKKTLTVIFSAVLMLALIGGGFYYYWFFIKKTPAENTAEETAPSEKPSQQTEVQPKNGNLRQINVDISSDKTENQKTLQAFADNFLAGSAENEMIEIKALNKNNQAINPAELETALGLTLPAGLTGKLENDYSLFMKKENSEVRMGAAFKLSAAAGLVETLLQQEKSLPLSLTAFYLNHPPADSAASFSSSKYKNADIRYFNFLSPLNTSFDYSVITDKEKSYLIFATSKYSARSILDYMSEK
ncbi:MAG: hypothetical protein WC831_04030 [Parcubacteria group bacterium]|jgi:hypothetical protein